MSTPAAADKDKDKPGAESFRVFARLRPANKALGAASNDIRVVRRFGQHNIIQAKNLEFLLDHVWDQTDSQEMVYNHGARERVSWVLEGFNSTILCYGQTGSGKTHTMFGPEEVLDAHTFAKSDKALHGILPRACSQLFERMAQADEEVTYVVHVSYVECYNGDLRDVLAKTPTNLILRESKEKGLSIDGLSYTLVSSPSEVMRAVMKGNSHRVVAAMRMNERSSRGHAVITVHVREVRGDSGAERSGKLTLVDLAGMESSKKSYSVEGASQHASRQEEVKHINQSLWALGTVIERLSEGLKEGHGGYTHIPYRDSKLTRLLQSSLDGHTKSAFIATLRAEESNIDESVGTLRFAQRAKAIRVVVRGNVKLPNPDALQKMLLAAQEEARVAKRALKDMEEALARSAAEAEARAEAAAAEAKAAHAEALAEMKMVGESSAEVLAQVQHLEAKLAHANEQLARTQQRATLHAELKVQKEAELEELQEQLEGALSTQKELSAALEAKEHELIEANEQIETLSQGGPTPTGTPAKDLPSPTSGGGDGRPSMRRRSSIARRYTPEEKINEYVAGFASPSKKDGSGQEAALKPEEQRYQQFVRLATARKLALAAQGFEVENVFIDQLFDDAEKEGVPQERWHDFLREELPCPDGAQLDESYLRESFGSNYGDAEETEDHKKKRIAISNWEVARAATRLKRRTAQGVPSPVTRRVSIVPELVVSAWREAASPSASSGGFGKSKATMLGAAAAAAIDAEARARESEMQRASFMRKAKEEEEEMKGSTPKKGNDGKKEGGGGSGGTGVVGRAIKWMRSNDGRRLLLAMAALGLYAARRGHRLGREAENEIEHAPLAAEVAEGVCHFSLFRCVADDQETLNDMGLTCALRPSLHPFSLAGLLRCRAVPTASRGLESCPSHCIPAASSTTGDKHGSCTAHAASVLYKVANELRADCAVTGTCPLHYERDMTPRLGRTPHAP